MAAADLFKIKIIGKSGHGSMPQDTIDAALTASAVVMNLQHLVSRNTNPMDTLVITVGKMVAGTRMNVIAGEAFLEGTARSFSKEVWEKIPDMMKRVVDNTCAAYGASAEIDFTRVTPMLINDQKISAILAKSAEKIGGKDCIVEYEKTPGAEDFAYLTQKVPGALTFIGIRNDAKGINAPHHNDCFNMDEDGLKLGTKLYAQFALDYLEDTLKV